MEKTVRWFLFPAVLFFVLAACGPVVDRTPAEILKKGDLFYTPNGGGLKAGVFTAAGTEGAGDGTGGAPAVVEPDVYRFHADGAILYVANAYRGLVAFDVADRAHPAWLARAAVAGTPKDLYLHGDGIALLLDPSYGASASASKSSVAFLSSAGGGSAMSLLSVTELAGAIVDSRVVGGTLLVATNDGWVSADAGGTSGTSVSSTGGGKASLRAVSLASGSILSTFGFPGYCTAIHIGPTCVFVATQDASGGSTASDLIRYDLGADGALAPVSTVRIQGSVLDRFKLDHRDGVLRVVASALGAGGVSVTRAFTVDYRGDPSAPVSHEDTALTLAPGERLFATRFSGDVCYVVTYKVKDPLFVVSFADPVNPANLGQLGDIPGYSTHLEVVPGSDGRDRLFAVGVDDTAGFRVKASWFDASDPAAIREIGAVTLGDSWSYSAANWDWKRISPLPDLSAFAVPYYSWNVSGGIWAVALVRYSDAAIWKLCELPDSGDCLRTIPAAENLVYAYADDRLGAWRVAEGSAELTAEVVIAEDAAWASEIGGIGVKVIRRDTGAAVKTFDPASYDRTDCTGSISLPNLGGDESRAWYALDSRTVAKGPDGIHLLASKYDASGARSAVLVPVRVNGGLSLGTAQTVSDTSQWANVSFLPGGARFLPGPAGGSTRAVFHGGLSLFDAATGSRISTVTAENGINAFLDGTDAWLFSHETAPGLDGYGLVTAASWDLSDPASPKKRFETSFPGFPVHYAGGGRFLSAFEVRTDGAVSTVVISVTVSGGTASAADTETVPGALRAVWSETSLCAFLQGDRTYWGLAYAAARSAARPRDGTRGSTALRTASLGADGSIALADVGILPDAGWGASLVREDGRLAAQAGRAVAACDAGAAVLAWRSVRLLDGGGWNEPVVSLAAGRLYWSLGMEGIGREELR